MDEGHGWSTKFGIYELNVAASLEVLVIWLVIARIHRTRIIILEWWSDGIISFI